jgi:CRP-like cAMP-binding protein
VALDQVKALEFNRANFEILMRGNPQIALKLLKLFTKRIYDQRRRFMILTLNDLQARVADVFLMLAETDPNQNQDTDTREFKTTMDDIAHWAGLPTDKCREVLNHFTSQGRLEVFPDRIVVKNINEFVRFVNSRRRAAE